MGNPLDDSPVRLTSRAVRSIPVHSSTFCSSPDRKNIFSRPRPDMDDLSLSEHGTVSLPIAPESPPRKAQLTEPRKPPTPRGLRLNMRENRKEAIVTSSTLDFVALSACDKDMVQECDDTHTQTEALKRNRTPPTARPESGKCQRKLQLGAPPSEDLSSEDDLPAELGNFEMRQLPVISGLPRKDPYRPQSSRGDDSRAGGSRAGDSLVLSSGSDNASPRLCAKPFMMPRSRSLRLVPGTRGTGVRPPSSLLGRPPSSLLGELLARAPSSLQGRDCPSRSGSAGLHSFTSVSRQSGSLSTRSLSGMSSLSAGLARRSTDTPPGVPNAFEVHGTLVKCPAPKRPLVCSLARHRDVRGLDAALAINLVRRTPLTSEALDA